LLVFVLSTLSSLAALLPPSCKNLDFYTGAILLVCGLYGVGLKKDMLQILISLVISEFSIELMLTTLGEGTSVTLFLVLAANWIMAAIAARLDDLDVNKLQELRG
jgi:NADH:ubiquinone oxidoreductase subunit K